MRTKVGVPGTLAIEESLALPLGQLERFHEEAVGALPTVVGHESSAPPIQRTCGRASLKTIP